MNEWVAGQIREFQQLTGRRITLVEGIEMAAREDDGTGVPEFIDVPCLQLSSLYLHFDDGAIAEVGTYQDNDVWGLRLGWSTAPNAADFYGIFRVRSIAELSCGVVTSVTTSLSRRGNLSELSLFIEGRESRLVAGEIYENYEDPLVFCRDDESILLFPNADEVAKIPWK